MSTLGMGIISEMTREEIIDEILAYQRDFLNTEDDHIIKSRLVDLRVNAYRTRAEQEAGITVQRTPFGNLIQLEDEDS